MDLCIPDGIHVSQESVLVLQDLKLCMWCKHCTQRISEIVKTSWSICPGELKLRNQPTFSEISERIKKLIWVALYVSLFNML